MGRLFWQEITGDRDRDSETETDIVVTERERHRQVNRAAENSESRQRCKERSQGRLLGQ